MTASNHHVFQVFANLFSARSGRALAVAATLFSAAQQSHGVLIHNFELNGNLNDSLGGPALTASGGTVGATAYSFSANQGLTLSGSGLTNLGNYSIEMRVRLNSLRSDFGSSWIKLIDFSNLSSDSGLYSFDGDGNPSGSIVQFFPVGGTADSFTAGLYANVVITRDSVSKQVVTYAEGFGQFSFIDSGNQAVFSSNVMHFMIDDFPTSQREAGSGSLDYIRIHNSVLSATEVQQLSGVPDGGATIAMLGLALTAVGGARRKFGVGR